jgi:hypothetical protein
VSILVRLYPRAWRERYGDELAILLEDRPPGPFDVADLALAALDAHLHLGGLGHRSELRKGLPMSLRLAGLAAAVAGGFWILFFAIAAYTYANATSSGASWIPIIVVAGLALLVGLAGLSAFQFRHHSRWIWIAFVLPAVGTGIVLLGLPVFLQAGGEAARGSTAALVLYIGLGFVLIGSIIFAAVTISTRALSRIAAGVIIVGVLLTIPSLGGAITAVWLAIGGAVFGLGWIGLGLDAIRRDRRTESTGAVLS